MAMERECPQTHHLPDFVRVITCDLPVESLLDALSSADDTGAKQALRGTCKEVQALVDTQLVTSATLPFTKNPSEWLVGNRMLRKFKKLSYVIIVLPKERITDQDIVEQWLHQVLASTSGQNGIAETIKGATVLSRRNGPPSWIAPTAAFQYGTAQVLATRLPNLEQLSICASLSFEALVPLRACQNLKYLLLGRPEWTAGDLNLGASHLPPSLTELRINLEETRSDEQIAVPLDLQALTHLTALRSLLLNELLLTNVSALSALTNLTNLHIVKNLGLDDPGSLSCSFLTALPSLQELRLLTIGHPWFKSSDFHLLPRLQHLTLLELGPQTCAPLDLRWTSTSQPGLPELKELTLGGIRGLAEVHHWLHTAPNLTDFVFGCECEFEGGGLHFRAHTEIAPRLLQQVAVRLDEIVGGQSRFGSVTLDFSDSSVAVVPALRALELLGRHNKIHSITLQGIQAFDSTQVQALTETLPQLEFLTLTSVNLVDEMCVPLLASLGSLTHLSLLSCEGEVGSWDLLAFVVHTQGRVQVEAHGCSWWDDSVQQALHRAYECLRTVYRGVQGIRAPAHGV